MNDKGKFYIKVNGQIAKQIGLSIPQTSAIRSLAIGYKKTREEIVFWAMDKWKLPRHYRNEKGVKLGSKNRRSKQYYEEIVIFMAKCTDEQWALLTSNHRYVNPEVKT